MFSYLYDRFFIKQPYIRRLITKFLEGDKDQVVKLIDCSIYINSLDEHGYLRASRMARFSSLFRDELSIIFHLAALLPNADTFIDVGANIGLFSASLSRLKKIYNHLNFYAIEANPHTFLRLQKTLEGLPVKAYCSALAEQEGEL